MKPIMALFATIGLMGLWGCGIFRVDPSAYDRACAEDRECTLVSSGCLNAGCGCASFALNRSGAQEFTADRDQSCVGAIPSGDECICPVLVFRFRLFEPQRV